MAIIIVNDLPPDLTADEYNQVSKIVEEKGKSPIAWQGAQLSRAIEALLRKHRLLT